MGSCLTGGFTYIYIYIFVYTHTRISISHIIYIDMTSNPFMLLVACCWAHDWNISMTLTYCRMVFFAKIHIRLTSPWTAHNPYLILGTPLPSPYHIPSLKLGAKKLCPRKKYPHLSKDFNWLHLKSIKTVSFFKNESASVITCCCFFPKNMSPKISCHNSEPSKQYMGSE